MKRSSHYTLCGVCLIAALSWPQTSFALNFSPAHDQLYPLFANHDDSQVEKLSASLAKAHPDDLEVQAWSAVFGHRSNAIRIRSAAIKQDANSPWTKLVRCVVANGWEARDECDQALSTDPTNYELLLLASKVMSEKLHTAENANQERSFARELQSFVDAHQSALDSWPAGLATHAELLRTVDRATQTDHIQQEIQLADRALASQPDNVRAILVKSSLLQRTDKDASEHLIASAAPTSTSLSLHLAYWEALSGHQHAADAAEAPVIADARSFFQRVPQDENSAQQIMGSLSQAPEVQLAIGKIIVQQFPQTSAADLAGYYLLMIDDPHLTADQNETIHASALATYLDAPEHPSKKALFLANQTLAYELPDIHPVNVDRLYKVLVALDGDSSKAIETLAEHKQHLPELEKYADKQLDAQWKTLYDRLLDQTDKDGFTQFELDEVVAPWQSTLGWVYYQEGKLSQAEQKLSASLNLYPKSAETSVRLGHVNEAEGDTIRAEQQYRSALALPYNQPGEHIAIAALRDNYLHAHPGDNDGLSTYLSPILVKDKDRRRQEILAAKLALPKSAPGFQLKTLDGKGLSSESLKGKTVVINFWATWCGPCRRELPDLQKLYEKYKDNPRIIVLSMSIDSSDTPVQTIRDFIDERHYTFPVLLGADYGEKNSIMPIPMTWFLDPQGRKAFEKMGYTRDLQEEFTWRIDAISGDK